MIENLKKEKQVIKTKKSNKGITLIALVITIIVLLILAGVSIATLTGENGILTQADKAKTETEEAEIEEQVKLAIMGSYGADGKINIESLNDNLGNIEGYIGGEITKLPATVTVDVEKILIKNDGSIKSVESTVAEAKTAGTKFNKEAILVDSFGNTVTIPEGFKIAEDSVTDVTGGIVIEDDTYTNTKGSQFVWIPVGTVTGTVNEVEKTETIKLSRYTFDESGKETDQGENLINSYFQELSTSSYGNAVAKDIEAFISSANNNHGYYIGRYEARKSSAGNLTVVGTDKVYHTITQLNAATVARNMYSEDLTFISDLMNSYAWDTAIVFEQTFDNRTTDTTKPYSRQNSLNTTLSTTGTNNLIDTTKQDKICNIWDMASNCYEWTTETYSDSYNPCVTRGGGYDNSSNYTSIHNDRPLRYVL